MSREEYEPDLTKDLELAVDILTCDPIAGAMWLNETKYELVQDLRADGISADETLVKRALLGMCAERLSMVAVEVARLIDTGEMAEFDLTVSGVRAVSLLDSFRSAAEVAAAHDKDVEPLHGELRTLTRLGILIQQEGDAGPESTDSAYCVTPIGKTLMPVIAEYLLDQELLAARSS